MDISYFHQTVSEQVRNGVAGRSQRQFIMLLIYCRSNEPICTILKLLTDLQTGINSSLIDPRISWAVKFSIHPEVSVIERFCANMCIHHVPGCASPEMDRRRLPWVGMTSRSEGNWGCHKGMLLDFNHGIGMIESLPCQLKALDGS
jgi:hypothetical protein